MSLNMSLNIDCMTSARGREVGILFFFKNNDNKIIKWRKKMYKT